MQKKDSNDSSEERDIAALSGMALQHYQAGDLEQAKDDCHRVLREEERPDAILILAKIAHEQGDFEEAVERYEQLLGIIPDHEQTHYYLGVVLEKLQRWEEAAGAYQQVLALNGNDVGTMIRLGNIFSEMQLYAESISLYERVLSMLPENAAVHSHLGAALVRMGQINRAIASFEEAIRLRPDFIRAHIDLSRALRQIGKAWEAIGPLETAIELSPENGEAHMQLSSTFRQLGETGRALEQLERYLTIRPTCGEAYFRMSQITPKEQLIPVVEHVLVDPDLPIRDATYCHFALGNLLDSTKSLDRAFEHYLKANALQRETFTYHSDETSEIVGRFIDVYCNDFFQGKREFGSESSLPVFIVGMPRSGTTLVEQILASHPLVHGAGETEAFPGIYHSIAQQLNYVEPNPECMSHIDGKLIEEFSARYLRELAVNCPTAERITDKFPQNFFTVGLIKTLFPHARIIHCQRNPLDNCTSLFFHCFTYFKASFELTELGQYYLQYQRLMSHWDELFPNEIFMVQYEDLVLDQELVSKQLVEYVGLEWDEKCLEFHNNERNVLSPSNLQVRQPMYESSINKWKSYENHLQPLIDVLQQAG